MGLTASAAEPAAKRATENVILLMTDGLRWQEVFSGAEETLMTKENGGVNDVDALKKDYWRDTPEARREALMPFLWTVVAKQGQIYGNQAKGSVAQVTNGMNFSYPGLQRDAVRLCRSAHRQQRQEPQPERDRVRMAQPQAAIRRQDGGRRRAGTCFRISSTAQRCGFPVNSAYDPLAVSPTNPRIELINR